MEDLANELSQRVQIGLDQARTVLNQVSNTILRKADPNKASELLSKLPSSITTVFSLDEKKKFTTTQENINNEEVVENIDREARINQNHKRLLKKRSSYYRKRPMSPACWII
jgi:hypothetical protein